MFSASLLLLGFVPGSHVPLSVHFRGGERRGVFADSSPATLVSLKSSQSRPHLSSMKFEAAGSHALSGDVQKDAPFVLIARIIASSESGSLLARIGY